MNKINTVIVGCGRVAHHYLSLFKKKKISNYKIVAVCDKTDDVEKKIDPIEALKIINSEGL